MTAIDKIRARIAELRAIEAKATPGPWVQENNHPLYPDGPMLKTTKGMHVCYGVGIASVDEIEFITASRNSLPALLDALEKAVDALTRVAKECDPHSYGSNEPTMNAVSAKQALTTIAETLNK